MPEAIADEVEFLRANVYMALGRPADAVEVLADLQRAESLTGFAAYNLGIALLQDGRTPDAIEQLDRAGRVASGERGAEAIRDKANLILGTMLFESADYQRAYAVAGSRTARRAVLEPGAAARGLGRSLGGELRTRARPLEHPRQTRGDRFRRAGGVARRAVRLRQARDTRPRGAHVRARARGLHQRARQGRRLDRQHPQGQVPEGAAARGAQAGQGLGDPAAHTAGDARDVLPHGADGLA